jgi:hypothetical protein
VAGFCKYGAEPAGSGATELVGSRGGGNEQAEETFE